MKREIALEVAARQWINAVADDLPVQNPALVKRALRQADRNGELATTVTLRDAIFIRTIYARIAHRHGVSA